MTVYLPKANELKRISDVYARMAHIKLSMECAAREGKFKIVISQREGAGLILQLQNNGFKVKETFEGHQRTPDNGKFEVSWE